MASALEIASSTEAARARRTDFGCESVYMTSVIASEDDRLTTPAEVSGHSTSNVADSHNRCRRRFRHF